MIGFTLYTVHINDLQKFTPFRSEIHTTQFITACTGLLTRAFILTASIFCIYLAVQFSKGIQNLNVPVVGHPHVLFSE